MPFESIESRRYTVSRNLQDCVDNKVLQGGRAEATAKAEEALKLARTDPILPEPWPQLAAYRLSHLLMRSEDLSTDTLRRIEQLFEYASQSRAFGPLPFIYRLAALSRLQSVLQAPVESDCIRREIERTFERALQAIRHMSFSASSPHPQGKILQGHAFNLLELASYFLGARYQKLEGSADFDYFSTPHAKQWQIVGRGIEPIYMTEEFARCEFAARSANSRGTLLIELNEQGAKWGTAPNTPELLQDANDEHAKLLLLALRSSPLSIEEIRHRVVGTEGEDPRANFRKVKERTIKKVRDLFGNPELQVFSDSTLNDEIPVIGLVKRSVFRDR